MNRNSLPAGEGQGPCELILSRVFEAPRELVFAAWTDPDRIVQWWIPYGFTAEIKTIDVRPGGSFHLELTSLEGDTFPCKGTYRDIVEPQRIVIVGAPATGHPCGAGLPPEAVTTVTLEAIDNHTRLTLHTVFPSAPALNAARDAGFNAGWTSAFEALGCYLTKRVENGEPRR